MSDDAEIWRKRPAPTPDRTLSEEEWKQWQRREAALEVIGNMFHGGLRANYSWEYVAELVFLEMRRDLGEKFIFQILPHLKERFGEAAALRMIPEIKEIAGDEEARRIFNLFRPLTKLESIARAKRALRRRRAGMQKGRGGDAQLIREKHEENQKLPREQQRGLGGVNLLALTDHIRGVLQEARKGHLKVVMPNDDL
jgi:hypothetical protein